MSAHLTLHDIRSIEVRKKQHDESRWLEINFHDINGERHKITVFAERGSDGFNIAEQVINVAEVVHEPR